MYFVPWEFIYDCMIQWSLLGRAIYSGACTITLWLGKWCAADDWTLLTDNFKLKFSDVWMSSAEGTLCDTDEWEREEWHRHEHVEESGVAWILGTIVNLVPQQVQGVWVRQALRKNFKNDSLPPWKMCGLLAYCFEMIAYIGHGFNRHSPFLTYGWYCHVRICLGTQKRCCQTSYKAIPLHHPSQRITWSVIECNAGMPVGSQLKHWKESRHFPCPHMLLQLLLRWGAHP